MLGALDAEWVVEVELQSHQTCIAKEMFVYSAEKDAIVYTETGRVVHIRQGKRKRSVCSHPKGRAHSSCSPNGVKGEPPKVAHRPLTRQNQGSICSNRRPRTRLSSWISPSKRTSSCVGNLLGGGKESMIETTLTHDA